MSNAVRVGDDQGEVPASVCSHCEVHIDVVLHATWGAGLSGGIQEEAEVIPCSRVALHPPSELRNRFGDLHRDAEYELHPVELI